MKNDPCKHPLLRKSLSIEKIMKLSHGDKMLRARMYSACQLKKLKKKGRK